MTIILSGVRYLRGSTLPPDSTGVFHPPTQVPTTPTESEDTGDDIGGSEAALQSRHYNYNKYKLWVMLMFDMMTK